MPWSRPAASWCCPASTTQNWWPAPTGLSRGGEELQRLYALLGVKHALAYVLHNDEHSFLPWHRLAAYEWMEG